jgi:hypothetical protein
VDVEVGCRVVDDEVEHLQVGRVVVHRRPASRHTRPVGSGRPRGRAAARTAAGAALVAVAAVWGWTRAGDPADGPDDGGATSSTITGPAASEPTPPELAAVPAATTVVDARGALARATAASRLFFESAPVVVLAAGDAASAQRRGADAATDLGVPMLVTPPAPAAAGDAGADTTDEGQSAGDAPRTGPLADGAAVRDELERLAPEAVLAFGAPAERWARQHTSVDAIVAAPTEAAAPDGAEPGPSVPGGDDRPAVIPAEPDDEVVVLVEAAAAPGAGAPAAGADGGRPSQEASLAAGATAAAAGAQVVPVAGTDPRADPAAIASLAAAGAPPRVVAFGAGFGPADRLRGRVDVAATGVELPGGGQVVFPDRRMVALYGHPTTPAMGVLGEQTVDAAVARAEDLAADYRGLVDETVVPAFEIITTVASSSPGADGDYSNESEVDDLRPWVDAAGRAGVYVVLDLQPGRTDFLTQAQRYEELLAQPHVGLALDPEWRLGPDQRHLDQIGTVTAAEVNAVADWLARLTRERQLPQKLLVVHQFRVEMIGDRSTLATGHDELALLIHGDGFGTPRQKFETWERLRAEPLPGAWWGWKNFLDEDSPTFTPSETVAVDPTPWFVSYQ